MDSRTKNAVRLMKDVASYGFDYLKDSHFQPSQMTDKQVLLMAYFTHALAHFDGVISLVCKPKSQPATVHLQTRALQETWVNMCLMTCTDDNTWSSYLYVISEYDRMKIAKWLFADNQMDQAGLNRVLNEASAIAQRTTSENPLPTIQGIVNPNSRRDYYGKQPLNLREKCQLIDHYQPPEDLGARRTNLLDELFMF